MGLLLLLLLSRVQLCATPQTAAHQASCPWDSPGKNTGVGCHFLLQCMKVKSESEAAQSSRTPSDPMDCSPPGSSIHGIFQARVLEWGAIAFSKMGLRGLLLQFPNRTHKSKKLNLNIGPLETLTQQRHFRQMQNIYSQDISYEKIRAKRRTKKKKTHKNPVLPWNFKSTYKSTQ